MKYNFSKSDAIFNIINSPISKAMQEYTNSPVAKAMQEYTNSPVAKAMQEYANSPVAKAMQEYANSPIAKAMQEYTNSPITQAMQEYANSPIAKAMQEYTNSPITQAMQNITKTVSERLYLSDFSEYVTQLNSTMEQFALLSPPVIHEFENLLTQNNSELLEAAKINSEPLSLAFEHDSENTADDTIILPEPVVGLLNSIDDSMELPKSDADKLVHIKKSDTDYCKIISIVFTILSIILEIYGIYQNNDTSKLLEKNHYEQMQETRKQTIELKKQTNELQKQNELMEKLLMPDNAATPASISSNQYKD